MKKMSKQGAVTSNEQRIKEGNFSFVHCSFENVGASYQFKSLIFWQLLYLKLVKVLYAVNNLSEREGYGVPLANLLFARSTPASAFPAHPCAEYSIKANALAFFPERSVSNPSLSRLYAAKNVMFAIQQ